MVPWVQRQFSQQYRAESRRTRPRSPSWWRACTATDTDRQLEESVQVLQAQLEEARRQLSTAAYANARLAYSPENQDAAALAQENAYLRDQNADLRRQVYALRGNYEPRPPGSAPPLAPPPPGEPPKVAPWMGGEIKQEPASGAAPYGVYGVQQSSVVSPPRVSSSSHGRTMSHPGDFVRVSLCSSSCLVYSSSSSLSSTYSLRLSRPCLSARCRVCISP